MRTTIDLPDDLLLSAKAAAVERGSTLRQVVIDALQRELDSAPGRRVRLSQPPVQLSADSPLRHLTPDDLKRLDNEAVSAADVVRAR